MQLKLEHYLHESTSVLIQYRAFECSKSIALRNRCSIWFFRRLNSSVKGLNDRPYSSNSLHVELDRKWKVSIGVFYLFEIQNQFAKDAVHQSMQCNLKEHHCGLRLAALLMHRFAFNTIKVWLNLAPNCWMNEGHRLDSWLKLENSRIQCWKTCQRQLFSWRRWSRLCVIWTQTAQTFLLQCQCRVERNAVFEEFQNWFVCLKIT